MFNFFNQAEKKLVLVVFCLLAILFISLAFISQGTYGGADNYAHYRISRYAYHHPILFLDLWGKPLVTLFSSPFSQFGFTGLRLFNVFCGLLSSFFAYRLAQRLKYSHAWLAILFCCFSPIYFVMIPTGLTEILFSLVLVAAVYCFFSEDYIVSTLLIAFIPFVRNEGFIFFPLFITALILKKRYKETSLLIVGYVFFSLFGYWVFDNVLWLFTDNPYKGAKNIYGHGALFDFWNSSEKIWGKLAGICWMMGVVGLLVEWLLSKREDCAQIRMVLLLVFGCFLFYFAAHSIVWWQGLGSSLGLIRVMAGVMPLMAVLCVKGVAYCWSFLQKFVLSGSRFSHVFHIVFGMGLSLLIVRTAFVTYPVPISLQPEEQKAQEAALWIEHSEWKNRKVFYYDPVFCHFTGRDPYDHSRTQEYIPDKENPQNSLLPGDLVVWDSHFGREAGMPLERLKSSSAFALLKEFSIPESQYTIQIFERK